MIPFDPIVKVLNLTLKCLVVKNVRKSARPDQKQQKIYSALGLKSYPGHTVKTTI